MQDMKMNMTWLYEPCCHFESVHIWLANLSWIGHTLLLKREKSKGFPTYALLLKGFSHRRVRTEDKERTVPMLCQAMDEGLKDYSKSTLIFTQLVGPSCPFCILTEMGIFVLVVKSLSLAKLASNAMPLFSLGTNDYLKRRKALSLCLSLQKRCRKNACLSSS